MKRFLVYLSPGVNIDYVVVLIESRDERNEILHVNRFLDYITVNTWNPSSLEIPGVLEVIEDTDLI